MHSEPRGVVDRQLNIHHLFMCCSHNNNIMIYVFDFVRRGIATSRLKCRFLESDESRALCGRSASRPTLVLVHSLYRFSSCTCRHAYSTHTRLTVNFVLRHGRGDCRISVSRVRHDSDLARFSGVFP